MHKVNLVVMIVTIIFSACSTYRDYQPALKATPTPVEEKTAPKPPEPKKELISECKTMNGEGRTFKARAGTMYQAQAKAMRECEISYRRCTLLKCESIEVEAGSL